MSKPLVGIVMGSTSDWDIMKQAAQQLKDFGVAYEARALSAHRTPDLVFEWVEQMIAGGAQCFIAGAGGAAHLAGVVAAKTTLPVLAVPIPSKHLGGLDSLLSMVQMPGGIPVATFAIGKPGAINWATWGPGSLPDLYLQWIKRQAGVDITGIPYKGAGAGNPAVFSGEADVTYMGFGVTAPLIKAGKLKPIVAVGTRRSSFMPTLSTLGEEGGDPGLQGYFAMYAPGKTPKPIVDKLNAELAKAWKPIIERKEAPADADQWKDVKGKLDQLQR